MFLKICDLSFSSLDDRNSTILFSAFLCKNLFSFIVRLYYYFVILCIEKRGYFVILFSIIKSLFVILFLK